MALLPTCLPGNQRLWLGAGRGHSLWLRKALALGGIRKEQQRRQGWEPGRDRVAPFPLWVVLAHLLALLEPSVKRVITIPRIHLKGRKQVYRKWQRLAELDLEKPPPAPAPL